MPSIVEKDGKYCLEGYGDADACYDSEEAAHEAQKKLMDMHGDKKEVAAPQFVEDTPLALDPVDEKSLFERLWDRVSQRLGSKEADEQTSFKTVGNAWVIAWSNNFEDRDGEIFTAKAMDDYVARVDSGVTPPPELWVWHVPGTRIGKAEWVARHGHFLVASGTFDDTPQAQKAKTYYGKHASKTGVSHGFTYPVKEFDGRHYKSFNTFEISLLPRGAEANLYTSLEGVKAMELSENKKKHLLDAGFEQVEVDRIVASWEAKGKALDELGVASKDFVDVDTEAAKTEAVADAEKEFGALVADLAEGSTTALQAVVTLTKDHKAVREELATALKAIDDLRVAMELRPRAASQAAETAVTEAQMKKDFPDVAKQLTTIDPFWNTVVELPLNGNS